MTSGRYDPQHITAYYDQYAAREWTRFDESPGGAANLAIHRDLLAEFVSPGSTVLEIGAGPGRFTIELARRGCRVAVTDISPVQLDLNRTKVTEAGLQAHVASWQQADVVDLNMFGNDTFDVAVAFGGPLSYVLDRADDAMTELVRVTRPGGLVLLSVMSLLGAVRAHRDGVIELARQVGVGQALDQVLETGTLGKELNDGHQLRLYTWAELGDLLERHGCHVLAGATANHLTIGHEPTNDEDAITDALLRWEVKIAREPGIRDAGTHILAAARTPQ